jgi:hypothetical protein
MSADTILVESQRIGGPLWGVIVPGVILLAALWVTWALYKHFSE